MRNKRGNYKYGVILSLILGVMVLGLSLYFIFNELWSSNASDLEVCRQSIQVRSALPDTTIAVISGPSFKNSYPLKCRTQVVNIDKGDVKNIKDAQKIIAETMATCWALYDKGDSNAFPAKFFKSSTCVPCARIHLTEGAKKELKRNGINGIDIRDALDLPMTKKYSYYKYLNNSGKKFAAFNFGNGLPFNLNGKNFNNSFSVWKTILGWNFVGLVNRANGGTFSAWMPSKIKISLPEIFEVDKGDLLINYGIVTIHDNDFGDYIPYLFYFQQGQTNPSPFVEVKTDFIINFWSTGQDYLKVFYNLATGDADALRKTSVGICEQWEGIPA